MINRMIILFGIIFGVASFPTLLKKSSPIWLPLYFINCIVNFIFDKILVETKQVKYPVRFLPKLFKINIVYDFLVCPYLSVWYCKSTYNSRLSGLIGKLFLFGIPQAVYEIILERKTKTLKFIGRWKWFYSAFLVVIVKLISRGVLELFKKQYNKNPT
ncbi:CBO0543 family protein [Salinibacillus xinjiangensis]|uniref:Uncharacterized protein n=1 Tax=Salinibacillus xinjiangensis TaxID=1229268 RepID=A0A6G1X7R6_9BACI|nr:CBO0543 family protein [Salinibacillus xinjiangensis]MRG86987.1 hypothetical protein [Salinibacillus xinjiangensis]